MTYLKERKVSLASIIKYNIGYYDLNQFSAYYGRMVFPIHNQYGEYLSMQGRAMYDYEEAGRPKYYHGHLDNKSKILYGLWENGEEIVKQKGVVIVEGPFDVIALDQSRLPAVALLGTTFSDDQAALIRRYTNNIVLWLDGDKAGVRSTENIMKVLSDTDFKIKVVDTSRMTHKDVAGTYCEYGAEVVRGCVI